MENKEYYEEITKLLEKLKCHEKEVFELALDIEKDYSAEEAKKTGNLIYMIWEAVVNYQNTKQRMEDLEDERYKQYVENRSERLKIIGEMADESKV